MNHPTKSTMNIAVAFNSKFLRYAYVMLYSLFQHQGNDISIHCYLMHNELSDEDCKFITELITNFGGEATWYRIDASTLPSGCQTSSNFSIEIYYRLLLAELLPEDVDRILYLDADTIIQHSLNELYFTDFDGKLLCACTDWLQPNDTSSAWGKAFADLMAQGAVYFNSGVLLLNIAELRKRYQCSDYMALYQTYDYQLTYFDQDLLNLMHWNEVKILDRYRYNLVAVWAYMLKLPTEQVHEAIILHFATPSKPWLGQEAHYPVEKIWWEYARQTPFYAELCEEFTESALENSELLDLRTDYLRLHKENQQLRKEIGKAGALLKRLTGVTS